MTPVGDIYIYIYHQSPTNHVPCTKVSAFSCKLYMWLPNYRTIDYWNWPKMRSLTCRNHTEILTINPWPLKINMQPVWVIFLSNGCARKNNKTQTTLIHHPKLRASIWPVQAWLGQRKFLAEDWLEGGFPHHDPRLVSIKHTHDLVAGPGQ